jgi:hypothetical protein
MQITLDVGIVNHKYVLRHSVAVYLYCDMFRLTLKKLSSVELKTLKQNYHVHHVIILLYI